MPDNDFPITSTPESTPLGSEGDAAYKHSQHHNALGEAVTEALANGAGDHIADASDAHDASAISILDTANDFTATDVEGALAELQSADEADEAALTAHVADTTAAHAASAISYAGGTGMSATDVEAAIDELATEKANVSLSYKGRMSRNANLALSSGANTILFDTLTREDGTASMVVAAGANQGKFTAPYTGWYSLTSAISTDAAAGGTRLIIWFTVGGTEVARGNDTIPANPSVNGTGLVAATHYYLTAGDVVTVQVYSSGSSSLAEGAPYCYFSAVYLP